jgi:8-oxo-dGTP pyrophosphatase MutT (NUDIX family)
MYCVSGVRLQSAALPYRVDRAGRPEVLLVTSARAKRWTIPKGRVELHLSLAENAVKEAREEAGIVGAVAPRSSGTFRTTKRAGGGVIAIEVRVYLLRVTGALEDWPEKRRRRIKWVSCMAAARLLREPLLRHLCLQLNEVHCAARPSPRTPRRVGTGSATGAGLARA